MSRSSVNLHLAKLEEMGLVERRVSVDPGTKRQRPTDYILAISDDDSPESETETRPQDVVVPGPKNEHGSVSENEADPCPKNGESRVRILDTKNHGKEPGIEPPPLTPKGGRGRGISRFGVSENVARRVMEGRR